MIFGSNRPDHVLATCAGINMLVIVFIACLETNFQPGHTTWKGSILPALVLTAYTDVDQPNAVMVIARLVTPTITL